MNDLFDRIEEYRKEHVDLVVVSVVEKHGSGPVNVGKKMLVTADGYTEGTIGGGMLEAYVKTRAQDVIKARKSMTEKYLLRENQDVALDDESVQLNMACGGRATLYYEFVGPRQYVYVFGGGHCGHALIKVLKPLGFFITLIDNRPEVLEWNEAADERIKSDFIDYIRKNGLRKDSLVVVATPSHAADYDVLNEIVKGKYELLYFGMLCSRRKLAVYLDDLYKSLGKDVDLRNFYSPVGLELGDNSPEDIAISIAAEMLEVLTGRTRSRHLRETLDDTHRYWER